MDIPKKTHKYTVNRRIELVAEYEATETVLRGGMLRRCDITDSTMSRWRKQKRDGLLEPSEGKQTPVALSRAERAAFIRLKSENATLKERLASAESTVDVLGKASALLESLAKSARPQPIQVIADPPAWGQRYQRSSPK